MDVELRTIEERPPRVLSPGTERRAEWRSAEGLSPRSDATLVPDASPRVSAQQDPSQWTDWRRAADTGIALAVLAIAVLLANASTLPGGVAEFLGIRVTVKNVLLLSAFAVYWQSSLSFCGVYDHTRRALTSTNARRLLVGCTIGSLGVLAFPATSTTGQLSLSIIPLFWIGAMTGMLSSRMSADVVARARRSRREMRRVMLVGSGPRAAAMWVELRRDPEHRYDLVQLFDTTPMAQHVTFAGYRVEPLDALERTLMYTVVDQVVIALPVRSCYAEIEQAIRICERAGVQSHIPADVFRATLAQPRIQHSGGVPVVAMHVVPKDWRVFVKRVLDVFGATVLLVLLSPLFAVIALAVRVSSPGSAFFAQERYGWQKRRFRMHKFRTMVSNAEALQQELESRNEARGPVFKIKEDPRVTRIGRFLRRTSLDELPQLWNVFRGDMSLVGPRPLPTRDVGRFDEPWLMRRFSVRPGLTCLWQISGRSDLGFDEWVRLDLEYIDRWSLALDFQILLRTPLVVLKGVGAS